MKSEGSLIDLQAHMSGPGNSEAGYRLRIWGLREEACLGTCGLGIIQV